MTPKSISARSLVKVARCRSKSCEHPGQRVELATHALGSGTIVEVARFKCGHQLAREISRVLTVRQLAEIERRHFGHLR